MSETKYPDTGDTAVLDELLDKLCQQHHLNLICPDASAGTYWTKAERLDNFAKETSHRAAIHDHVAALVQAEREIPCPHCGRMRHER